MLGAEAKLCFRCSAPLEACLIPKPNDDSRKCFGKNSYCWNSRKLLSLIQPCSGAKARNLNLGAAGQNTISMAESQVPGVLYCVDKDIWFILVRSSARRPQDNDVQLLRGQ